MNGRLIQRKIINVLLPVTLVMGVFLGNKQQKVLSADASSYSVTSVPTTIDLNDSTASEIRSYYSSLNSLGTTQRQGTNLLKNLKPILKNNQKYLSYGSSATTAVWQAYEIVDRDWTKSPASAISGYNSSTNKITGYAYGTSNSNSGSNPYIHALYVNRSVTNQTRAWGNHNQDQWGINQEHIWAKSCGFNDNSPAAGARGDIMHLWAGNGKVNGTYHSNYYYGYVDTTQSYDDASSYASTLSGNRKGKSKTLGGSYTVFEPQDSDKGDIARALFYMAARYNYLSGSDSDGIDAGNPNLEIVNVLNWAPGSSYTSTTSKKGQMGILQDLLEWNRLDPPDEWEIHRNNLCYKNYTNNRNPFIDFPEWAEFIWGKSVNGSYNSSSTGYAAPNNDTINGYNGGQATISVTGISLNKNSTSIEAGKSEVLIPTISPSNATNQALTWSTSNSSVATVSGGTVYGVSEGNAVITVTTNDGGFSANCNVTITAASSTPDGDAELYSGALTEGDYVVCYDGKALKNSVTSNRFDYSEITPINNTISSPSSDIVWHIAKSGDYWTIYNNKLGKYAAGTGTKNQGALSNLLNDYAKWSVTGSSTYEFVNKGNQSDEVNCNLRNNGSYGFACYSTSTGGALSLYKVSDNSGSSGEVTSIIATCSKTFYVGETISSSDITVKDNLGNSINDFEFDPYLVTYEDTPIGGNLNFELDFDIEYNGFETNLSVDVARKPYETPATSTINHSGAEFGSAGIASSYTTGQTATVDGITFSVDGYIYSGKLSLSNGKTSAPGKVINTTPYSSAITDVTVNGASPDVQLSTNGSSWVDLSKATPNTVNYFYLKIFYKTTTQSSYINITSIDVTLKGAESPNNVANYIMYEDTNNQCTTKFDIAKGYFENLTKAQRNTFMTSDDYVISTAKTRFEAWARSLGKTIVLSNGDYVISNAQSNVFNLQNSYNIDTPIIIMIVALFIGTGFIVSLYFMKHRKEEK